MADDVGAGLDHSAGTQETGGLLRWPSLTIGMATFDDYDGVYFSIQALRMYHARACSAAQFIIVDNNPDGASSQALRALAGNVPNLAYVAAAGQTGSALAKQRVFDAAIHDVVLCIDCHVLLVPGALDRLLDHFAANPHSIDLVQGPLLMDDLRTVQTHFDPVWRSGMYGIWGLDQRGAAPDAPPFEILMQGMGAFACRREAWPGFNPAFRGFGGEEFYIHEKFRQRGGRALCLPSLRWMHRFARPAGVPYRNVWEDRIWNYWVGFRELGLPTDELVQHFCDHVGRQFTQSCLASMR